MSATTDSPTGDEPQFKFLEALLGLTQEEPEPEPTPEQNAEARRQAVGELGEAIQDVAAIALGVRASAIESGMSPENADVMAMSTYATTLSAMGANRD